MKFMNVGQVVESNIFNQLEQKKKDLQAQGKDMINLSIGTPDFAPDAHVMQAVQQAAGDPNMYKYALNDQPELLDAVCAWYDRRYGVQLAHENITSIAGSQEGIAHICFPFVQAGDLVLAPDPGYPIFTFGPMMAGAEVGLMPLLEENGYLIDLDAIPPEVAQRAKMMVVSYPNNPTTAIADVAFYKRLIAFAKQYDIIILHDNAYSDLMLDGQEGMSFLSVEGAMDVGMEVNSLSKTYNLTGMRVSFVIGKAELVKKFQDFRSQIDYGMFLPMQKGAIAALNGSQDIVLRNRAGYRARRDALCGGLRRIGWDVPDSKGSMFVWAKIPAHFTSSTAFVLALMEQAGIVCVPGTSFGACGEGYVRFALVVPPERLEEAVQRIADCGILQEK